MRDLLQTCLWRGPAASAGATRRYDELFDDAGMLRPHWESFVAHAESFNRDAFDAAGRRIARQLHDNGVTYNVQAAGSPARVWALDVLPHIVTATEWERLITDLRQRARLLEEVMRDIYGSRQLVARGVLPPALVFGHRGFLPAAHGVTPPGGAFLQLLAFDLGRGADGEWRVMATRTQAPSGAGYLLENRLTISRLFPDAFREQHVQRLAPFFRALQENFRAAAPGHDPSPLIVLLTPGRYNETYFEHAYLSRYLGFTLVEGPDLTVRDDCVFLKTVGGLRRVHVILRRLDDDFCDPVELRADSALGVPGLVQAWRAGNVLVANAFGSGVLESPALNAFLPAVADAVDGAPLGLASPRAWWCGDVDMLPMIEQRLSELVIMPAVDAGPTEVVIGAHLDAAGRQQWIERLRTWPERYVAEEYVPLAYAPTWTGDGLERRALLMRVFLAHDGNGNYHVLPGGLSRIGDGDVDVFTGQRGGGSKDTWVLSAAPVEPLSLLPGRQRADIVRGERVVSSRAAEHLFWMGRYAERSENAARLLRAILSRQFQGDASVSAGSPPVVAACRQLGVLPADVSADAGAAGWEQLLIAGITDATGLHSLAFNVTQTLRVASTVRDRLSSDNWRLLNRLTETLTARGPISLSLAEALELLDEAIIQLVAVGGLEMAHMTRDDGWRFMSLGRHLERVVYVIESVSSVATSELAEDPALLAWLLDLSDSIITYRAQYMGHAEWTLVADLLLFDRRNPRSAAFQLAKLAKHVPQLPGSGVDGFGVQLRAIIAAADEPGPAGIGSYLETAGQVARHLSDVLERRYFSHVYEPAHATLI